MTNWNDLTEEQKEEAMNSYYEDLAEYKAEHPEEDFSDYVSEKDFL